MSAAMAVSFRVPILPWAQSPEDEARFQVKDPEQDVVEQNQSLHYTERSVGSNQLHGDHIAGPWRLDWTLSTNDSRQQEPDVRFFRNSFVVDSFVSNRPANSTEPENTRRIWRNIEEDNWQLSSSGDFSFEDWTEDEEHFRIGFNTDRTNRLYEQTYFGSPPNRPYPGYSSVGIEKQIGTVGGKSTTKIVYVQTDAMFITVRITAEANGIKNSVDVRLPIIKSDK